ncbi:hypothetical protein BDV30DRAFT_217079 [Aspergillus minisclerotigenes]|uniref:BZIP domain-containing protein n=1 Tax=Aspergillus minisclerotigenes TaxID=656917 RepID=A0A5N6ISR1_9EURO|nr:hypothetical protein BDV30DRAFT_217079 [Aspergillus minisclerotigenes]
MSLKSDDMPGNNDVRISKRRKRVITPARKEQNRVAQRVYRQRQKERLRGGKHMVRSTDTLRVLQPTPGANHMQAEPVDPIDGCTADVPEVDPDTRPSQCLAPMTPMKLTLDHFFPSEGTYNGSNSAPDPMLPDLYQNTLESANTMLLRACLHNAQRLGISMRQFFGYECMSLCSPFYRANTTMSDDPQVLIKNVSSPSTPAHLQPTLPQILFPHHPILDLLPLPTLRTRAVMLAATAPTSIDAVDLKRDIIERAGIVCRGGQPWDMHSWVAAPWFLKKWKLLLGHL